jgi:hypothetical protein
MSLRGKHVRAHTVQVRRDVKVWVGALPLLEENLLRFAVKAGDPLATWVRQKSSRRGDFQAIIQTTCDETLAEMNIPPRAVLSWRCAKYFHNRMLEFESVDARRFNKLRVYVFTVTLDK